MDYSQYLNDLNLTPELLTFFYTYLVVVLVITLVIAILQIIAMWKIFTKAGEKGWKALIPIYNAYIYFKIAGIPGLYWLLLLLTVLTAIPVPIVSFFLLIGVIIINVYHANRLAHAFGHGAGYTFGLLFLNLIFLFILGFGSSQYQLTKEN